MREVLRNMFRRKFRTVLTIFGITIGIFAFTVMGSMALKFNKMISGGKKYITGQITIAPKGSSFAMGGGGATLPVDTLKKIGEIEGVEAVASSVSLALDEPNPDDPTGGMSMGTPPTINGEDMSSGFKNKNWDTLAMKEGRMIENSDADDKVTFGYSVALDKKVKVGEKTTIRGREFEVVGIADKTMSGPDNYVFMKIKPARELYIESNPFLKSLKTQADEAAKISEATLKTLPEAQRKQLLAAKAFNPDDISTMASISWKDNYDPEKISQIIKDQYKNEVMVYSPKKMGEEIDKASAMFNAVILGAAILALVVGGFSIINTMIMSISERTREIGIKKAIGASNNAIAKEYTLEAGIIGLLGGLIGTAFGSTMIVGVNQKMAAKGAEIFLFDKNFLIGVVIFSFVLGILAGAIPAWRASKLNPVAALREE